MKNPFILMLILPTLAQADFSPQHALQYINQIRAQAQQCGNKTLPAVPPLKWSDALYNIAQQHTRDMASHNQISYNINGISPQQRAQSYTGWEVRPALFAGKQSLAQVVQQWRNNPIICEHDIMSPDITEMAIATTDAPQSAYGVFWAYYAGVRQNAPSSNEMLSAINAVRSQARMCGRQYFQAAPPLKWHTQLQQSAQNHANEMAKTQNLSHTGANGSTFAQRIRNTGYNLAYGGENVASGQMSVSAVVASWLNSAGHCANIMNPNFREMGMAYASNPQAKQKIFWVQNFASRIE